MNTPAHMALGLAALGGRGRVAALAILAGAILPDLFLYLVHFGAGWAEMPVAIFNSAPLWLGLCLAGLALRVDWVWLLAASALLHIAFDLPLHNRDAHAHFWPFTDWAFVSPVSFWDADHHGRLLGTLEGILFVVCLAVIWRRTTALWERALLVAFAAVYLAAFVHFLGHVFADAHWAIW